MVKNWQKLQRNLMCCRLHSMIFECYANIDTSNNLIRCLWWWLKVITKIFLLTLLSFISHFMLKALNSSLFSQLTGSIETWTLFQRQQIDIHSMMSIVDGYYLTLFLIIIIILLLWWILLKFYFFYFSFFRCRLHDEYVDKRKCRHRKIIIGHPFTF